MPLLLLSYQRSFVRPQDLLGEQTSLAGLRRGLFQLQRHIATQHQPSLRVRHVGMQTNVRAPSSKRTQSVSVKVKSYLHVESERRR